MSDEPVTIWQIVKNLTRRLFCRHKGRKVRTVSAGSDPDNLEVLARYERCEDCDNWLKDLPITPEKDEDK